MELTTTQAPAIQAIALAEIHVANNDRKHFDAKSIEDLAGSIKAHGLAQPITVRRIADGFELVAGERRFRAHQLLGVATIDAIVRDLSDEGAAGIMLVENTGRVDLSPIEEANAYRRRIDEFGSTPAEVATAAGVSSIRVKYRLDLLNLRPEIQHQVHNGPACTPRQRRPSNRSA
jgi:ParB family transcriptional regulator, chromosome partitioning protein